MNENPNHLDLKGCVKSNGILCIPIPEMIRLLEKFPYLLGRDFKEILQQAIVSDKIKEIGTDEKKA